MSRRFLKLSLILFLAYMLLGCSASYHIKRAKKLAPEYFTTKIDTVRDTIFIEVAKVDTLFKYIFDTVEMYLDRTFVKYHYDTLQNDVFIEVDCPDDSVVTETIYEKELVPYPVQPSFLDVLNAVGS